MKSTTALKIHLKEVLTLTGIAFALILLATVTTKLFAATLEGTKLKDLVTINDVRENPIIGYGLVIGLNGTGDDGAEITGTSLKRMFQKLGLNPQREIASKNVASVVLTAKLPPFARVGQKVDVVVSSIGNAASLAGGTLLVTPLKGGDGFVYAVAEGAVSIGGLKNGKKFPTAGMIPGGGTVEKEIDLDFDKKKSLRLSLVIPDFTTAARIEKTINQNLGGKYATAKDATTIDLIVPVQYQRDIVTMLAIIENFRVVQDNHARIVINEKTGTIVAGGDITLNPVAIGHGDLTISIGGDDKNAKDSKKASLFYLDKTTKLQDLVQGLNSMGATPEDLISIFQMLKRNGALVGEIETL